MVPGKWPWGEPLPADTPPCEGCKKKKKNKKLVLPFCLPSPSARPMAPPDCLRVGCAPSKWLPSSSAEPPGAWDSGHWGWGGVRGRGGDGIVAGLCGAWAVGVEGWGWCACGGQNEPNEAEAGGVGGGLGSACSLRLGLARARNFSSPQILWRVEQRLGVAPTAGGQEGAEEGLGYPAVPPKVATRGRSRHAGEQMRAGGEWAVSPEVQPSTAPVWGAGGGGEILPNGGALGGD